MVPFLMVADQPFPLRAGTGAARAFDGNGLRKRAAFQRMSAAASRYYRADLGQLDESTQRIFLAWADSQNHRHVLVKEDDGAIVLYAEREAERQNKKPHGGAEDDDQQLEDPGPMPTWLFAPALRSRVPRRAGKLTFATTDRRAHGDRTIDISPSASSSTLRYGDAADAKPWF